MAQLKYSTLETYISFFLYKIFTGVLFSISVFFLVEDDSILSLISILILQEFYFSYFYTAKKNQAIKSGANYPLVYFLSSSAFVFSLLLLFTKFELDYLVYLFFLLNLAVFSFYAHKAPLRERVDVTSWVKLENKSGLFSVIVIFLVLLVGKFFELNFDLIILCRLGIVYLILSSVYLVHSKVAEFSIGVRGYLESVDVVLILLLLKLYYFEYGQSLSGVSGLDIKIYLLLYDFLAALLGLYIRRVVALSKMKFVSLNNAILFVNTLFLIWLFILVFFASQSFFNSIASTLIFLSVAINYNYFSSKDAPCTVVLKLFYIFVLFSMWYMSDFKIMLAILYINFVYSFFCRLKC